MRRYSPMVDKLFWILFIPTNILVLGCVVVPSVFEPSTLFITLPIFLFVNWFFISPLFGYAELREDHVLVRYGIILKRTIPYASVKSVARERRFYSDALMSLKNAFEHVCIRYGFCDVTVLSLKDNDGFAAELRLRCGISE